MVMFLPEPLISAESIYLLRQPSVMRQLLYASSPQHLQVATQDLGCCTKRESQC